MRWYFTQQINQVFLCLGTILQVCRGPEMTYDAKWRWKCKFSTRGNFLWSDSFSALSYLPEKPRAWEIHVISGYPGMPGIVHCDHRSLFWLMKSWVWLKNSHFLHKSCMKSSIVLIMPPLQQSNFHSDVANLYLYLLFIIMRLVVVD